MNTDPKILDRLATAVDTTATAAGYDSGEQCSLRIRLARASRPARRIVEMIPVD